MELSENIKQIREQFDKVIKYSQNYDQVCSESLFELWYERKKNFIEAWGGKMIYEVPVPVSFEMSAEDRMAKVYSYIEDILLVYQNEPLAKFIAQNKEGFFQNKVISPNSEGKIIPVGMKLLKAFKFFEKDPRILEKLQNQASMIIQEDKVEGTLCFSVHPLDFLSLSETTYNWRSCHALDGDYRAGNISYMVDNSTVICYLRGKKNVKLPNFPEDVLWNAKKWRMLLFFSKNWKTVFAGRQYPFFNREPLDIVLRQGPTPLANQNWNSWNVVEEAPYKPKYSNFNQYIVNIDNVNYFLKDIVKDGQYSHHFNDILRSSCYRSYYTYTNDDIDENPVIEIGQSAPCLRCGKSYIELDESMMCLDCEMDYGDSSNEIFCYCDCCDQRMLRDEAYYLSAHEHLICEDCYETYTRKCAGCLDIDYIEFMTYDESEAVYYCCCCK